MFYEESKRELEILEFKKYMCVHLYIYIYKYVCVCVYIHVCVYIYIYTFNHHALG